MSTKTFTQKWNLIAQKYENEKIGIQRISLFEAKNLYQLCNTPQECLSQIMSCVTQKMRVWCNLAIFCTKKKCDSARRYYFTRWFLLLARCHIWLVLWSLHMKLITLFLKNSLDLTRFFAKIHNSLQCANTTHKNHIFGTLKLDLMKIFKLSQKQRDFSRWGLYLAQAHRVLQGCKESPSSSKKKENTHRIFSSRFWKRRRKQFFCPRGLKENNSRVGCCVVEGVVCGKKKKSGPLHVIKSLGEIGWWVAMFAWVRVMWNFKGNVMPRFLV